MPNEFELYGVIPTNQGVAVDITHRELFSHISVAISTLRRRQAEKIACGIITTTTSGVFFVAGLSEIIASIQAKDLESFKTGLAMLGIAAAFIPTTFIAFSQARQDARVLEYVENL